ncbi:Rho GTPase activating protein [Balamuthia mandrillaris]
MLGIIKKKKEGSSEEDLELLSYEQKVKDSKLHLRQLHETLGKSVQSNTIAADHGHALAQSLRNYAVALKEQDQAAEPELGNCLEELAKVENTITDLSRKFNSARINSLLRPIDDLIKGEIAAAEQEKKKYDKAKAAFEAADAKVKHLKVKEDAKAFETEKERNILQKKYEESKAVTKNAFMDAYERNKVATLERLCDYVDAYKEVFRYGFEAFATIDSQLNSYRSYIAKKRSQNDEHEPSASSSSSSSSSSPSPSLSSSGDRRRTIVRPPLPTDATKSAESLAELTKRNTVLEGWINYKQNRSWRKLWATAKFKYLYLYNNPLERELKLVVPLTHCSIDVETKGKANTFAINGRLESYFFRVKPKEAPPTMEDWVKAVKECTEEEEVHQTREYKGKRDIKGQVFLEQDEDDTDSDEEVPFGCETVQRHVRNLVKEERRYVQMLDRISKMYRTPLEVDPKLKSKLLAEEVDTIFGNIKPIAKLHAKLLQRFESILQNLNKVHDSSTPSTPSASFSPSPPSSTSSSTSLTIRTLQANGTALQEISSLLQEESSKFEQEYINYVSKISNAMYCLVVCRNRAKVVRQFLKERRKQLGEGNELEALLALPLQRLAAYAAFLDEAGSLHQRDRAKLTSGNGSGNANAARNTRPISSASAQVDSRVATCLNRFRELSSKVTTSNALSLNLEKMLDIRRRLVDYEGNLVDPKRVFLQEGSINLALPSAPTPGVPSMPPSSPSLSSSSSSSSSSASPAVLPANVATALKEGGLLKPSYVFLFNDLIVFAKSSNPLQSVYKVVGQLPLHRAVLTNIADSGELKNILRIEATPRKPGSAVYYLQTASPQEKDAWLSTLTSAIEEVGKARKVYGLPLVMLMDTPREQDHDIPTIVDKVVSWIIAHALEVEGIFRLPGRLDSIEAYKDKINNGNDIHLPPDENPYVVASLLTHWLMELPETLCTRPLYSLFVGAIQNASNEQERCDMLIQAVKKMPLSNRFVLQHLISLFLLIVEKQEVNKMGLSNLAIVFSVSLLASDEPDQMWSGIQDAQAVIQTFITHYNTIFSWVAEERKQWKLSRQNATNSTNGAKPGTPPPAVPKRPLPPSPGANGGGGPPSPTAAAGRGRGGGGGGSWRGNRPSQLSRLGPKTLSDRANLTSSFLNKQQLPQQQTPPDTPPRRSPSPLSPRSIQKQQPLPQLPLHSSAPSLSASLGEEVMSPKEAAAPSSHDINEEELEDDSLIVKEGWLAKKGGKRRNWNTRWCVLRPKYLSYFKDKTDAKPKGTVVLSGVRVMESARKQYCFAITLPDRTYLMAAKDAKEQEEWMQAIQKCIL